MNEQGYTVKFKVNGDAHYMNVPASSAEEAHDIFQEWMFGESGEEAHLPSENWREMEVHGNKVSFRNDWVASFEVLQKGFMIRD